MRKKIFGGLVALALALAPAVGANAAPYVPGGGGDPQHGTLSAYVGAPGDTITYTADPGTYGPAEALSQTVVGPDGRAAPVLATDQPSEADGSHTFSFIIPADAKDGDQFVVDVLRADGSVWDHFVVTAIVRTDSTGPGPGTDGGTNPVPGSGTSGGSTGSGSGGGLAMTGSDIAITGMATGAVLLFVGGVVLLVIRRRRSRAAVAA